MKCSVVSGLCVGVVGIESVPTGTVAGCTEPAGLRFLFRLGRGSAGPCGAPFRLGGRWSESSERALNSATVYDFLDSIFVWVYVPLVPRMCWMIGVLIRTDDRRSERSGRAVVLDSKSRDKEERSVSEDVLFFFVCVCCAPMLGVTYHSLGGMILTRPASRP